MNEGDELEMISGWLHDTLTTDTALTAAHPGGLWDGIAPEDAQYPFTRIDLMSAVTVRVQSFNEIMVNSLWLVRGITSGSSYAPLRTGAKRIWSLLHGKEGITVTGGMIVASTREQPFRQPAVEGARQTRHLGGIYRIYGQAS